MPNPSRAHCTSLAQWRRAEALLTSVEPKLCNLTSRAPTSLLFSEFNPFVGHSSYQGQTLCASWIFRAPWLISLPFFSYYYQSVPHKLAEYPSLPFSPALIKAVADSPHYTLFLTVSATATVTTIITFITITILSHRHHQFSIKSKLFETEFMIPKAVNSFGFIIIKMATFCQVLSDLSRPCLTTKIKTKMTWDAAPGKASGFSSWYTKS